jgi:hypothetical protein
VERVTTLFSHVVRLDGSQVHINNKAMEQTDPDRSHSRTPWPLRREVLPSRPTLPSPSHHQRGRKLSLDRRKQPCPLLSRSAKVCHRFSSVRFSDSVTAFGLALQLSFLQHLGQRVAKRLSGIGERNRGPRHLFTMG